MIFSIESNGDISESYFMIEVIIGDEKADICNFPQHFFIICVFWQLGTSTQLCYNWHINLNQHAG